MEGMTLSQFKFLSEFVQSYHRFAHYPTEEIVKLRLEAGLTKDVATYGLNIKYVRCDYDTRDATVWGITFDNIRFSSNHFNAINPPPKQTRNNMSKEAALKPFEEFNILSNDHTIWIKRANALKAMDDYTEQLRTELEEVKESRDKYRTAIELQEALVNALRTELETVKKQRDQAIKLFQAYRCELDKTQNRKLRTPTSDV